MRPCWCEECGCHWDAAGQPDCCPNCNAGGRGDESWKAIQIERCYECPLTALEEAMEGRHGHLINRAFRLQNLLDAKVQVGLANLTVEEAHALELISMERPRGLTDGGV
jgi:hypothetical protein